MNDLYVGYRPVPARTRTFLRLAIPALLWLMCAVAAAVGWRHARGWGDGLWSTEVITLQGPLALDPYATVHTADGPLLIVEAGKVGIRDTIADFAAHSVAVTGTLLQRDGHRMMELLPGDDGIRILGPGAPPDPANLAGTIGLMGEVVDYKCFLGAMKPGRGFTHKSCAALCIRGGIPPALISEDGDHYLLTGPDGEPFNEEGAGYVGRRVALAGDLYEGDGRRTIRVRSLRVLR